MARARQLGPIIPRPAHHDPEGTEPLVASASADWRRRLRRVRAVYVELLDSIPREEVTVNAKRYTYRLWPDMLSSVDALVDAILLEGGAEHPWLWSNYVEAAYVRGTARAVRNLARQSTAYRSSRATVRDALQTPAYARRTAMVRARVFEEMKGLGGQVKSDMGRLLADGVARGKGPLEIARNLSEQLNIEDYRAERIARTEVNTALRRARWDETEDAQAAYGLKSMEMHLSALSPTTREEHAARHGKLFTLEASRDWFADGANSINCFVPATKVRGRFVAGSKSHYSGAVIKIVTAGGRNLTVTPNHPVLTTTGMVPAAEVGEGDCLLAYASEVEDPYRVADLDDQHVEASIEDVFTALVKTGETIPRRIGRVDFHGDGAAMDEQVDIVTADRVLTFGVNTSLGQRLDELAFIHADAIMAPDFSATGESLVRVAHPASRFVRSRCQDRAILCSGTEVPVERPGLASSKWDAGLSEDAEDRSARSAELFGNRLRGDILQGVELDHVVRIDVGEFCGHVYDLQELSGLMIANDIILSNCKCSTVTVLVDEKGEPLVQAIVDSAAQARRKFEQEHDT